MLSDRQIARLLDLGNLACQKGLVSDARTILDGVLALRPDFAPAQVGLAFTHVVVDDFDGAVAILDKVLDANPADSDALAVLGLSHMLAGRQSDAEQAFARIPQDSAAADMARAIMEAS